MSLSIYIHVPAHLQLSMGFRTIDLHGSGLARCLAQEYEFSRVFGPEDDNQRLFSELQVGTFC